MPASTSERLEELIATGDWDAALALSRQANLSDGYVAQCHFLSLALPSPAQTDALLAAVLPEDPLWVTKAAVQVIRTTHEPAVVHAAAAQGLAASDLLATKSESLCSILPSNASTPPPDALAELCLQDDGIRQLCLVRRTLLDLADRARTWAQIWPPSTVPPPSKSATPARSDPDDDDNDPWGIEDRAHLTDSDPAGWDEVDVPPAAISLPRFLRQPLADSATELAASGELDALLVLALRHAGALWPLRLALLDAIPEWADPSTYRPLLVGLDDTGAELHWPSAPWRATRDWVELPPPPARPHSPDDLTAYYTARVETLASLGLASGALSLVQHCASLGVPGLDALGEELSLLSKLVYDRPIPPSSASVEPPLTLDYWRSLKPPEVLRAYVAYSTPASLAADLRRLVLPYLSVLESRLERAGTPEPNLSERLLHEYIFDLAATSTTSDLALLVAVFEASIPTLPRAQRLIKSDEELSRLAIACLYGCPATSSDALVCLGKVLECLPALEAASPSASTSSPLFSLTAPSLVPPTISMTVRSLRTQELATTLDTLDLHLTTAETFSRYSAPVPLGWFLTSHNDVAAQRAWATRLARTSAGGGTEGGAFESDDEWEGLMEDLLALVDGGESDSLKKAFWLLSRDELLRIFFGGLLAAGKFGLARSLFRPSSTQAPLDPKIEEELVIAASREFYDNAETGNLYKGNMKLAFDCLAAAPQTLEIKRERDFIEATSRLCSFNVYSQPGVPITPIEIRLSKDRLSIISHLLSSNEDAYRHPDMILDLVSKLGYRGDVLAEIRTLAMIADSGFQASDYVRAADTCDRIVAAVQAVRKRNPADAADLAWQNCFQLGKHPEFRDLERRMQLLGQALVLCPADQIATLLPYWTALEDEVAAKNISSAAKPSVSPSPLGIETASRTLNRAAAFFPFGGGEGRVSPTNPKNASLSSIKTGQNGKDGKDGGGSGEGGLRAGIGSRFTAGVGWLIGADEAHEERY